MLDLTVGPYSRLEELLAQRLAGRKANGGLPSPAVIVAPSWALIRHLHMTLVSRYRLALANVKFHTYQNLARTILLESQVPAAALAEDPLLEDRLVEDALHSSKDVGRELAGLAKMPGLLRALGSTIRDLEEARVDPAEVSEQALKESADDTRELVTILPLLKALAVARKKRGLMGRADIVREAAGLVRGSAWVRALDGIFYYGAYDLTQQQLDLLFALAEAKDVEVMFPALPSGRGRVHEVYRFSEPTLTLMGQKARTTEWLEEAGVGPTADRIAVWEASSQAEQWSWVARECLRLTEDEGISPDEIAVVARSLDGHLARIAAAFSAHGLSFTTRAETKLVELEIGRALAAFIRALSGDMSPGVVLDLVAMPRLGFVRDRVPMARARALSRRLWAGATAADWERLRDLDSESLRDGLGDVAKILVGAVDKVSAMAREFPVRDTWKGFTVRLLETVEGMGVSVSVETAPALDAFVTALGRMRPLGVDAKHKVEREMFWRTALRVVEDVGVRLFDREGGVRVVDVMDGRGLTARVIFLAELVDRVFPRVPREDPFLRDGARRVLNEVLGYKIQLKGVEGVAEERLLFHSTVAAARERLYLVSHTGEIRGRAATASSFLEDLAGDLGVDRALIPPPAGLSSRPEMADLATRQRYAAAAKVVAELENVAAPAGRRDGLLAKPLHLPAGVRVTQLVELAVCPFRMFSRAVLGLTSPRGPRSPWEPEAATLGLIVHAALDRTVTEMKDAWLTGEIGSVTAAARAHLYAIVGERLPEAKRFPVLRAALISDWEPLLVSLLEQDLGWCREHGLKPRAAEESASAVITVGGVRADGTRSDGGSMNLRGRIDRVDTGAGVTRLVDYKSHLRKETIPAKARFDPAFYQLALYRAGLGDGGEASVRWAFSIYHVGRSIGGVRLVHAEGEVAEMLSERAGSLNAVLGRQIGAGNVAPFPAEEGHRAGVWKANCGVCEFRSLCRRDHGPTLARLRMSDAWSGIEEVTGRGGNDDDG